MIIVQNGVKNVKVVKIYQNIVTNVTKYMKTVHAV